jgi:hypothetical protein
LFTLLAEIVCWSVAWSLLVSMLAFRVDRVRRLDRLIPARFWSVPRKMAT